MEATKKACTIHAQAAPDEKIALDIEKALQ
jgi:hypothetical protein